jgi:ornithine cyclodeaminase/alanine dehydrogenase-like protein (mu-crystallin family)
MTDVFVYDIYPEKTSALLRKLSPVIPDVELHQPTCVEDLLKERHIVITATTSLEPVLPDEEDLLAGKHFVGIGSYKPNMREFPRALFHLVRTVYVDTEHALGESGDLIVPLQNNWITKDQVTTLGRFLVQSRSPAQGQHATTLFKSVGMALFDVCAAKLIYDRAAKRGLGQKIIR